MAWPLKLLRLALRGMVLAIVLLAYVLSAGAFSVTPGTVSSASADAAALAQRCQATPSDAQALPICLRAAQLGHPRGMASAAAILFDGEGVQHDLAQARQWGERAAALGDRGALFMLGRMHEEAAGVPRDLARAAGYYERSARLGFAKAQFALGISYEFGQGLARDRDRAIGWLAQAGAQGDGRARWFAQWLRRADTPRFASEDQLAAYINGQVARAGQPAGTAGQCGNGVAWVCNQERDRARWASEYHPPGTRNPYDH